MKYGLIIDPYATPDIVEDTKPLKSKIVKPWEGLEYDSITNIPD